jgi:hypothetical protein
MERPIKFTPKEGRPRAEDRLTRESRRRMSEGGKKGGAKSKPKIQAIRDGLMAGFLERNPLSEGEFYARLILGKDHHRHFKVSGVEVSINGDDWFTIGDVRAKLKQE